MNDKSRVCKAVTLTFNLLSLAPMVYHKASPGDTIRDRPLQNLMTSCFAENKAKQMSEFSECASMSITSCGSFRRSLWPLWRGEQGAVEPGPKQGDYRRS